MQNSPRWVRRYMRLPTKRDVFQVRGSIGGTRARVITRSPTMIGLAMVVPRTDPSHRHRTFLVTDHSSGGSASGHAPVPSFRKAITFSAAGRADVKNSKTAVAANQVLQRGGAIFMLCLLDLRCAPSKPTALFLPPSSSLERVRSIVALSPVFPSTWVDDYRFPASSVFIRFLTLPPAFSDTQSPSHS